MDFTYAEFLELPEDKRFEYLTSIKLNWWKRLEVKILNKWWTYIRGTDPELKGIVLWESLYKGRF